MDESLNHEGCILEVVSLSNNTIVYTHPIIQGIYEGELRLSCGAIDHAGEFIVVLKMKNTLEKIAQTDVITVSWPDISVTLPRSHKALTSDITGMISTDDVECESKHPESHYWVELAYFGKNHTKDGQGPTRIAKRIDVEEISDVNKRPLTFECRNFDQAGIYKLLFKSAYDVEHPMALSNAMSVEWSQDYSLSSHSDHILPCNRYVRIQYTKPSCAGNNDQIRLFKRVPRTESSVASPTDLVYITERRAKSSQDSVTFQCDLFHESIVKYCFKYISTANNGAVTELGKLCLPTIGATGL